MHILSDRSGICLVQLPLCSPYEREQYPDGLYRIQRLRTECGAHPFIFLVRKLPDRVPVLRRRGHQVSFYVHVLYGEYGVSGAAAFICIQPDEHAVAFQFLHHALAARPADHRPFRFGGPDGHLLHVPKRYGGLSVHKRAYKSRRPCAGIFDQRELYRLYDQ